jgi:predicted DNA-binding protein YlxM (UPF0122 family)
MPNQDKQQLAKDLYLHTDKTQQEIADILNVNRRTVYLWIKHGRWEEFKVTARQTPLMLVQNIYNYIDEIDLKIKRRPLEERCPTDKEVNMMHKLLRMTNLIARQQTGAYMEAYEELIKYLYQTDVALAQKVVKAADRYIMGFLTRDMTGLEERASANVAAVHKNLARQEEELKAESWPDEESTPATESNIHPQESNSDNQESSISSPVPNIEHRESNIQNQESSIQHQVSCDNNAILCDINGMLATPADIRPKPAIVKTHEENDNTSISQNIPQNIFPENRILPQNKIPDPIENSTTNSKFPTTNSNQIENTSAYYASLPPSQRPSPFREGNIIWVNNRDDISDDDRKMGDSVRLYGQ